MEEQLISFETSKLAKEKGFTTYNTSFNYIYYNNKGDKLQKVADLRGWGAIQLLFKNKDGTIDFVKAEKFQDELGLWVVDAINEKLNKEKGL